MKAIRNTMAALAAMNGMEWAQSCLRRRVAGPALWLTAVLCCAVPRVFAAWSGAGVAGADLGATNINDVANWTAGMIDGNFGPIVSNVTLRLSADQTFANGLNFTDSCTPATKGIVITGMNTLTLGAGYVTGTYNVCLPTNENTVVTLARGLTLDLGAENKKAWGKGTLIVDARIVSSADASKTLTLLSGDTVYNPHRWPSIVFRNDANSFQNGFFANGVNVYFTSIANKGVPSSIGAGQTINTVYCPLTYIGPRDGATDREWQLNHNYAGIRNDSGCGTLCFTGAVTFTSGGWHSVCTFGGLSSGESLLSGNLIEQTTVGNNTKLIKTHSGTWRLTGHNTFIGITNRVDQPYAMDLLGGTLIADYANDVSGAGSNRLFLAGRKMQMNDVRLVIRGKSGAGNTTWQSFFSNYVVDASCSTLVADGNGGDGTTVSMGPVNMPGARGILLVEKRGNATVRTANPVPVASETLRNMNGVLMGNSGERATLLVKDSNGAVGFAGTSGDNGVVRFTDTLALTADNASPATNHVALASNLTRAADLNFSTLTIDASAQAVVLDLGGYLFQNVSTSVGRGVAVWGNQDVVFANGTHGAQAATHIYNYGAGKFLWSLTNAANEYVVAGPGLTEFSQQVKGSLYIFGGTVRLTSSAAYTAGAFSIGGDAVLEIGADLNGATAGDFTRTPKDYNATPGQNEMKFLSGGGFSAYGADRTVNLNNNTVMTWGPEYYNISYNIIPDGKAFTLGSPTANATLIFANPIDLRHQIREIRVQDGSASVDACLTNTISGYPVAGLVKSGAGTLELKGRQTYRGPVTLTGGTLLLGANSVYAGGTNPLALSGGALSAGAWSNSFDTLDVVSNSVIDVSGSGVALSFADSSGKAWSGTLTISGKLGATSLRFGTDSMGLTAAQRTSISNNGRPVGIDAAGYLYQIGGGTLIKLM